MKKCIYCQSDFTPKNPKGRFCSNKCRVYWNRKKGDIKEKLIPQSELTTDKPIEEDIKGDIDKPVGVETKEEVKLPEMPNMDNLTWEQKQEAKRGLPKTLDELKALCPKNLSGFDRSRWVLENRAKYGI